MDGVSAVLETVREVAAMGNGLVGLGLWLGVIGALVALARWRWGSSDTARAAEVSFELPVLPPEDAIAAALEFGITHEPLADRLYADGFYASAADVYSEVQSAYDTAAELAARHQIDEPAITEPRRRVNESIRKAKRKRDFWSLTVARIRTGHPREPYSDIIARGEAAASWGDKLFDDGHYESARREYETARHWFDRARTIREKRHQDTADANVRLERILDRIETCRRQAT